MAGVVLKDLGGQQEATEGSSSGRQNKKKKSI